MVDLVVDDFTGGMICGVLMAFLVASIAALMHRWFYGGSTDTLAIDEEAPATEPDLQLAVIDYAFETAIEMLTTPGLTPNEYRGARARLSVAMRGRRGESLSDTEIGVLLGVIKPPSPGQPVRAQASVTHHQDVLPVLWTNETS